MRGRRTGGSCSSGFFSFRFRGIFFSHSAHSSHMSEPILPISHLEILFVRLLPESFLPESLAGVGSSPRGRLSPGGGSWLTPPRGDQLPFASEPFANGRWRAGLAEATPSRGGAPSRGGLLRQTARPAKGFVLGMASGILAAGVVCTWLVLKRRKRTGLQSR